MYGLLFQYFPYTCHYVTLKFLRAVKNACLEFKGSFAIEVISKLYEKVEAQKATTTKSSSGPVRYASSSNTSSKKIPLSIGLIKPISGTVTSRFGSRWGSNHKGIDIGAAKGTKIKASAGGTVVTSSYGYNGGYGNYVVISHGNGIETAYGHCSELYVKVGQKVSQGDVIAAVGNTGRSYGNHLHLEIRVNGVAQNPQNYLLIISRLQVKLFMFLIVLKVNGNPLVKK